MTWHRDGRRWTAAVALALYAAFLAFVTLSPSAGLQVAVVAKGVDVLSLLVPDRLVTGVRVEMGLNALMVAPLTFLTTLVFRRFRWQDWTAYGFLGACLVELVQGVVLAGRSAMFVDVVANTLGAFLGAAGAAWWLRGRDATGDT